MRVSTLSLLGLLMTFGALAPAAAQDRGTAGPDVTIIRLEGPDNHGSLGDIHAFSIGTDSCNIGDTPLNWCDNGGGCSNGSTNLDADQHPVIAGNLYRLKDDRFEQIGKSWLKHGFLSLNTGDASCVWDDGTPDGSTSCQQPPLGGDQLGVGCTDLYTSGLNGSRPLGMRSEVDAAAGTFVWPRTTVGSSTTVDQRIQVHADDLEPTAGGDATYFIEGHYVVDDDAAAGNALNNASYIEVSVNPSLQLSLVGSTVREKSAIHAWVAEDPTVRLANADFVGSAGITERFEVARKVIDNGGSYTTNITIHNMNVDVGAGSFTVQFPGAAAISATAFRDVDSHSGEFVECHLSQCLIEGTDWPAEVSSTSVIWSVQPTAYVFGDGFESSNTDAWGSPLGGDAANVLKWGTSFSFSFTSTADPTTASYTIGLRTTDGGVAEVTVPFDR